MRMFDPSERVPSCVVNGQRWEIHVADQRAWRPRGAGQDHAEVPLSSLRSAWLVERMANLVRRADVDPLVESRWIMNHADWKLISTNRVLQQQGDLTVRPDGREYLLGVLITVDPSWVTTEEGQLWLAISDE